jgi:hypothetical protein
MRCAYVSSQRYDLFNLEVSSSWSCFTPSACRISSVVSVARSVTLPGPWGPPTSLARCSARWVLTRLRVPLVSCQRSWDPYLTSRHQPDCRACRPAVFVLGRFERPPFLMSVKFDPVMFLYVVIRLPVSSGSKTNKEYDIYPGTRFLPSRCRTRPRRRQKYPEIACGI